MLNQKWVRLAFAVLLAIAVWVALQLRWPGLTRPFWGDEIQHNHSALSTDTYREFQQALGPQFAPQLDFLLRRLFWAPIFGANERTLRLSSLVYDLAAVLIAGIFAAIWAFQQLSRSTAFAIAIGTSLSFWVVTHPTHITYATEARHYSLISLLSILTVGAFFALKERKFFWISAFLLSQTHFYGLVVVGSLLFAEGLTKMTLDRRAWLSFFGIVLLAVLLNDPSFRWMVFHGPQSQARSLSQKLDGGLEEIVKFFADASLFLPLWILLVLLWPLRNLRSEPMQLQVSRILWIAAALVPALFWFSFRFKSDYPISTRYFTPFHGLYWAVGTWFLIGWVQKGIRWKPVLALGLVFTLPLQTLQEVQSNPIKAFHVPVFFSDEAKFYSDLRALERPIGFLTSHCWQDDWAILYLKTLPEPYRRPWQVADTVRCRSNPEEAIPRIKKFSNQNPDAVWVLQTSKADCESPALNIARETPDATLVRTQAHCHWVFDAAQKDFAALQKWARSHQFPWDAMWSNDSLH